METNECDPSKVVCSGDGLLFGYINHPIRARIDTTRAGPGELTVFCKGRERNAFCELREEPDGTFTMVLSPQETGLHDLHVQYDGHEVTGSPFKLRVSPAGFIKVHGPGLEDSLINDVRAGTFVIDTFNAPAGDVKVRVCGPKGRFRVETRKRDRLLECRYNPTYPGMYTVEIYWSGDQVPGSPFQVYLCASETELKDYITAQSLARHHDVADVAL